jgi:outer membrane protein OmpA-like peptidoglycan-associated protein
LSEIAKLMAERPSLKLLVVGHTDSRGTFDYNIDLSQRRAEAVVGALATRYGVQRNRLKPWGVGYAVPRASNNSDVGKSQNRRVELVVW